MAREHISDKFNRWIEEKPRSVALVCGVTLIVFTVLYLILVIVPFYANGIFTHSFGEIFVSKYDPIGFVPFAWGSLGEVLLLLAIVVFAFSHFIVLPTSWVLVVVLVRRWHNMRDFEKALWSITLFAVVLVFGLTLLEDATIGSWLLD